MIFRTTNAGKSTLFNRLVREKAYAADQLFATLDTTARRCWVSDEQTVVLSDTVGFIRGLPHQLVEAFTSANVIADPYPGADEKRGWSEHSLCRVSDMPSSAPWK